MLSVTGGVNSASLPVQTKAMLYCCDGVNKRLKESMKRTVVALSLMGLMVLTRFWAGQGSGSSHVGGTVISEIMNVPTIFRKA